MNEEKEKILRFTIEKFLREGFSKTTMDEIATELRISKKTIYKHFSSKDDLLKQTVDAFLNENAPKVDKIINSDSSSVVKFKTFFGVISKLSYKVSDKWIKDVQLHKPELWIRIDEFRTKRMKKFLSAVITQGIEEGTINPIPVELLFTVFMASIRAVISPDFLSRTEYTMNGAFNDFLKLFFGGLLTDEGKKQFQNIKVEIE